MTNDQYQLYGEKMEERTCLKCGRYFRVLKNDSQYYCSRCSRENAQPEDYCYKEKEK